MDKDKAIEEMKLKHEEDVSKLEVELNATTGELKETQDKYVLLFIMLCVVVAYIISKLEFELNATTWELKETFDKFV